MADAKLTALTAATSIAGTDHLYGVVGGNSRKVPASLLATSDDMAAATAIIGEIDLLTTDAVPILIDDKGRVALAVRADGAAVAPHLVATQFEQPGGAVAEATDSDFTDLAWAVADETGRMALAVLKDGRVVGGGGNDRTLKVSLIGDSLTAQGLTEWWIDALPGWSVENLGVGGQRSTQISARVGGIASGVTLAGNTMATGANSVTHFNGIAVAAQSSHDSRYQPLSEGTTATRTMRCRIAGVDGVLTRTAPSGVETYSFTPDAEQNLPAVAPPGSPLVVEDVSHWDDLCIIWLGRNDAYTAEWSDFTMAAIEGCVERLRERGNNRFVILTVPNGGYANERLGQTEYAGIVALNNRIMQKWPQNTFDVRRWLIDNGLSVLGLNATAQDLIDIADDTVPESVRSDTVHLNTAVYPPLALAIKAAVTDRFGWTA